MSAERLRRCCLGFGVAIVASAWLGPLPEWAREHFAALAGLHVVLVCIGAPLLAVSAAGTRYDPAKRWPHGFSPFAAAFLQWAVVWIWHTPSAQAAATASASMLWLEQSSFLFAAVLLWLSVLGGERTTRYERAGTGIVALLMTSMHMTLLGGLALIATAPFGDGLAAGLADRRLGALVILAGAGVVYMIAGAMLLGGLLRPAASLSLSTRVTGRS